MEEKIKIIIEKFAIFLESKFKLEYNRVKKKALKGK